MFKSFMMGCGIAILSIGVSVGAPLLHGDILVTERLFDKIYLVDGLTGTTTIFSGQGFGTGAALLNVKGISQAPNGMLYAASGDGGLTSASIIEIDPTTGNRRTISGNGIGNGVNFGIPSDVVVSPNGDIYVIDQRPENNTPQRFIEGAIIKVNILTGDRTIISSDPINPISRGSGPVMANNSFDIDILSSGELVIAGGSGHMLKVDPITGNREILSGNALVGLGDDFDGNPRSFVVANGTTIYAALTTSNNLFQIDIMTGNRTKIATDTGFLSGLEMDLNGDLLVTKGDLDSLSRYSFQTSSFTDFGNIFGIPYDIVVYRDASNIPEPTTALILAIGLISLAGVRRYA